MEKEEGHKVLQKLGSEKTPNIILAVGYIASAIRLLGTYIHFVILGGYRGTLDESLQDMYNESLSGILGDCFFLALMYSMFLMCMCCGKSHKGIYSVVVKTVAILQCVLIVIPSSFLVIVQTLYPLGPFMETILYPVIKILRVFDIPLNNLPLFDLVLYGISILMLFMEATYRKFVIYWLGLFFGVMVLGQLLFVFLQYKILAVLIGIIVAVLICVRIYQAWLKRCPSCGRWDCFNYVGEKVLREEVISMVVENKVRDTLGNMRGTYEQRIPGKGQVVLELYQCSKCGYKGTKTVTKSITSV